MEIDLDGSAFLARRLAAVSGATPPGLVVFDLDNTVFDTRPRTLAAAERFDALHHSHWFDDLALTDTRRTGRLTARARAVPHDIEEAFAAYWDEEFWAPASFALDGALAPVVSWVHAALAAGVEVRYLTGRIEALREASLAQLARIGLPTADAALVCKPDLSVRTGPFKAEKLAAWSAEHSLGWFMTEGHRDIASILAALPDAPCVLLECSFEEPIATVVERTPRLPRCF